MIILSHRGYWKADSERNSESAFIRSFDLGLGTETDVRDMAGKLVVSHDPPKGGELAWHDLLTILGNRHLPLAVNIKADGLAPSVGAAMKAHEVGDWFAFDMSVPDMRHWLRLGLPVFTRMSEVERTPVYFEETVGIWLDGFDGIWYGPALLEMLLKAGKRVCIVSDELHGRDPGTQWAMLRLAPAARERSLLLCTDRPEEARSYFGDIAQ